MHIAPRSVTGAAPLLAVWVFGDPANLWRVQIPTVGGGGLRWCARCARWPRCPCVWCSTRWCAQVRARTTACCSATRTCWPCKRSPRSSPASCLPRGSAESSTAVSWNTFVTHSTFGFVLRALCRVGHLDKKKIIINLVGQCTLYTISSCIYLPTYCCAIVIDYFSPNLDLFLYHMSCLWKIRCNILLLSWLFMTETYMTTELSVYNKMWSRDLPIIM